MLWLGLGFGSLDRNQAAVPSEWCAQWFSRAAMVSAAVALDVLVVWLVCVVVGAQNDRQKMTDR